MQKVYYVYLRNTHHANSYHGNSYSKKTNKHHNNSQAIKLEYQILSFRSTFKREQNISTKKP